MQGNRIEEHLDKLRSEPELWDIFTRREEYNPPFKDKYGRFPYYLSTEKSIFEPRVSKYLVENGLKMEYPDGKQFAVCLTHDIDSLCYSRMGIVTDVGRHLLHGQLREAIKRPFYNVHTRWNPWWNFKEIMDMEEEYGAKSTFFIMGLEEGDQDFNYRARDLSWEMGNITDRGWEVGLHGGHEAYKDLEALKKQKANLERALGKVVVGYRNHFLRFKVPETWELLEGRGFRYDATYGHSYCVGFRNGMCHPFRPYNLRTNLEIDILEIPLTIMDMTLYESYMRLDQSTAWIVAKNLIDIAEKYRGVITILWHNTNMIDYKLEVYKKILHYCSTRNAWITSAEEIYKFWTEEHKYYDTM